MSITDGAEGASDGPVGRQPGGVSNTDDARRAALLAWFQDGHRDLPWRQSRDPWAIWVSEIMLQQTRAASVVPYYEKFLARFPTPAALAAAPMDELLGFWAGLGYYARARNLHAGACQVVERHGGVVPGDPAAFRALSGVGPYTAGAVLSIAFGLPEPVLDGNVIRVLTRWDRLGDDPRSAALNARLWDRARTLAAGPEPGTVNQALMELGATICTPRSPTCLLCPVSAGCGARAAGDAERYPHKAPAPTRPHEHRIAGLVWTPRGVWLSRRPDAGLLAGLWELPSVTVDADGGEADGQTALARLGLIAFGAPRAVDHVFTHRHWHLKVYAAEGIPTGGDYTDHRCVPTTDLAALGLSGPGLKALLAWDVTGAPRRRGAGRAAAVARAH